MLTIEISEVNATIFKDLLQLTWRKGQDTPEQGIVESHHGPRMCRKSDFCLLSKTLVWLNRLALRESTPEFKITKKKWSENIINSMPGQGFIIFFKTTTYLNVATGYAWAGQSMVKLESLFTRTPISFTEGNLGFELEAGSEEKFNRKLQRMIKSWVLEKGTSKRSALQSKIVIVTYRYRGTGKPWAGQRRVILFPTEPENLRRSLGPDSCGLVLDAGSTFH